MHKCKITWLGHACFKIELLDSIIVVDPFEDGSVPGCRNIREKAHLVLCSHEHHDHNFRDGVEIIDKLNQVNIHIIDTYHDDKKGTLRGSNKIHIIDDGTYKIAHLGDLGCELEADQKELLKECDVVFVPVGGYYTIDSLQAKHLIDDIQPRITIPMHYRGDGFGFDVISPVDDFINYYDDVVLVDDHYIEVSKNDDKKIVVLNLRK